MQMHTLSVYFNRLNSSIHDAAVCDEGEEGGLIREDVSAHLLGHDQAGAHAGVGRGVPVGVSLEGGGIIGDAQICGPEGQLLLVGAGAVAAAHEGILAFGNGGEGGQHVLGVCNTGGIILRAAEHEVVVHIGHALGFHAVHHTGKARGDELFLALLGGLLKVLKKLPPFIAVPTTSGTGSETTIAAVITDDETHHKYAVMDLQLVPKYAVLDPEMTRGLPPKITAATGMDALTHAVEAYVCWTYNTKESLQCAEEATVAIFKYLERAYQNGDDMEARTEMLIASFKAGFAFTRAGVGNVHAIAHTLGGLYNTPHGLANAVILPIVLEDYGEAVYPRLSRLAELTGVCTSGTQEQKAKAFIKEIRAMNQRMDIPTGFDHIQEKDIPQMITWALKEANPFYPVPVVYDRDRCNKVIHRIIDEA